MKRMKMAAERAKKERKPRARMSEEERKQRKKEQNRLYYQKNRERILERNKENYRKNINWRVATMNDKMILINNCFIVK